MKKLDLFLLLQTLVVVSLLLPTAKKGIAQEALLGDWQVDTIFSAELQQQRAIYIDLPSNYYQDEGKKYPIVVLLDGERIFSLVNGIIDYLHSDERIEDFILIGIPNVYRITDFTPTKSNYTVDGKSMPFAEYSGGADTFLDFLEQELMPYLGRNYRVINDKKAIIGRSLTGLFVCYNLLKNRIYLIITSPFHPAFGGMRDI